MKIFLLEKILYYGIRYRIETLFWCKTSQFSKVRSPARVTYAVAKNLLKTADAWLENRFSTLLCGRKLRK